MSIYRLEPLYPNNPQWWLAATYGKVVWVAADSPDEARAIIARKTAIVREAASFASRLPSPWLEEDLARCVPDLEMDEMPPGTAMTEKGKFL
jgi:hypothetical protein